MQTWMRLNFSGSASCKFKQHRYYCAIINSNVLLRGLLWCIIYYYNSTWLVHFCNQLFKFWIRFVRFLINRVNRKATKALNPFVCWINVDVNPCHSIGCLIYGAYSKFIKDDTKCSQYLFVWLDFTSPICNIQSRSGF